MLLIYINIYNKLYNIYYIYDKILYLINIKLFICWMSCVHKGMLPKR